MSAPEDREALIDTIAQAHFNYGAMRGMRDWDNSADELKHAYIRHATFILDAIEAAGCVVVPVEPTQAMHRAAVAEIARLRAVVHRMVRESNDCAAPCQRKQCGCWLEAEKEMER